MAGSLQDSHIIYVERVYPFVGVAGILKGFGAESQNFANFF